MDHDRFDSLTRSFGAAASRRSLVRAFGGGLTALLGWPHGGSEVVAKNKGGKKHKKKKTQTPPPPSATCTPRCRRKVCGDDGCGGSCGSCAAGQVCASGTCCTPEPVAVTCSGRCGTVTNAKTCHQPVACSCPAGQQCLGNGSCAAVCSSSATICPVNGFCNCGASAEGSIHCYGTSYCNVSLQVCTSTTECPVGQYCQTTMCGPGPVGSPENRCWPLCYAEPT
jgi:hypothetical protein